MEEEKERKCVVKDIKYDFYYQGGSNYGYDIKKAIFDYNSLPNSVKYNHKNEVIFLDTKEGLELLAEETK
jgi:hypothetical protein